MNATDSVNSSIEARLKRCEEMQSTVISGLQKLALFVDKLTDRIDQAQERLSLVEGVKLPEMVIVESLPDTVRGLQRELNALRTDLRAAGQAVNPNS